jgi:hypothetical protein
LIDGGCDERGETRGEADATDDAEDVMVGGFGELKMQPDRLSKVQEHFGRVAEDVLKY